MIQAPTSTSRTQWLVWSPPTKPSWPPSMALCSMGFVSGPCCKPRPQGLGCAGGEGGREHWATGCGESAQACSSPTSQPTASLPPSRLGAQVTGWGWGQPVILSYTGRLSAGWRFCAGQCGCENRKRFLSNHGGGWALDEETEKLGLFRQCPGAREMREAKHTLLRAKERQRASTII